MEEDTVLSIRGQPSPTDFDVFLAWACDQLQVEDTLVISKMTQNDYISVVGTPGKAKMSKGKPSKVDLTKPSKVELTETNEDDSVRQHVMSDSEPGVQILAFYDSVENLVKLSFVRNRYLPQMIFKVIGLIIKFHYYLHTISINSGLNKYCVYEISKFLPLSHITDLCLDNSIIKEANYHLLLEQSSCLRYLSLARCSINDAVVETIAVCLSYPRPASKTLCILNLASNKITDIGSKFLSEAFRSNRQLSYLNLSDNMLTDTGAKHLLDTLLKFPLSFSELLASRSRYMAYLKQKRDLISHIIKELRAAGDSEKRTTKRKATSAVRPSTTPRKKGVEKEGSLKSVPESKSFANVDAILMEKAINMAEHALGEFQDPFDKDNTDVKDCIVYSKGNNTLSYLNLSYNNLSLLTLTKLMHVLLYQKDIERKPRGLVNVSINGNPMPVTCNELCKIDDLLETGLMMHNRRHSMMKKRPQSRGASAGTR